MPMLSSAHGALVTVLETESVDLVEAAAALHDHELQFIIDKLKFVLAKRQA